jgi:hypothetical protein
MNVLALAGSIRKPYRPLSWAVFCSKRFTPVVASWRRKPFCPLSVAVFRRKVFELLPLVSSKPVRPLRLASLPTKTLKSLSSRSKPSSLLAVAVLAMKVLRLQIGLRLKPSTFSLTTFPRKTFRMELLRAMPSSKFRTWQFSTVTPDRPLSKMPMPEPGPVTTLPAQLSVTPSISITMSPSWSSVRVVLVVIDRVPLVAQPEPHRKDDRVTERYKTIVNSVFISQSPSAMHSFQHSLRGKCVKNGLLF